MDWREHLRQALEALGAHPRRVVASGLGVFWGAAAIVMMMAWGTGFREFARAEIGRFGQGTVLVFPAKTSSGFPGYRKGAPVEISRDDAAAVERGAADRIRAVLPTDIADRRMLVEAEGRARRLDLDAADERYAALRRFTVTRGRFFDAVDVARARPVAVIGHEAAVELFGSADAAIGRAVRIEGERFEVIGVPDPKGRQYTNIHRPENRLVIVPITAAEERLGFRKEAVTRLLVFPRPGVRAKDAVRATCAVLGPRAGFHPDDVDAVRWIDTSEILGPADLFYAGFMVFIGAAGTVTLLVGAMGIANYQLAVLAERTVEIAVCKAIGARDGVLVVQTICQALLMSVGAAGAGVLLGLGGCLALARLTPPGLFPTPIVSPLAGMVTFAAVLGVAVVAAVVPAVRVRGMEVGVALRAT